MERLAFGIRNWMEFVDTSRLRQQIAGRNVYLWDGTQQGYLISFFGKNGIEVKGILHSAKEKEQKTDLEKGLSTDIYLVIAIGYRDADLMALLYDKGMKENVDYTYIANNKEISGLAGYYKDDCGNEIICEGSVENVTVLIQGYHNRLYIGKDFGCSGKLLLRLKGNVSLRFGRNIFCRGGDMFFLDSENEFGGNTYLAGNFFISNFGGKLYIGEKLEVLDGLYICVAEKTTLTVGRDCMMGKDVKLLSGAAHSLFDLNRRENINMDENTHVTIGDHVWLGMGSSVIYNSDIGDHSVLGADCVAKGTYPPHTALAGNIARVVRENIDWDHDDYVTYEQYEAEKAYTR